MISKFNFCKFSAWIFFWITRIFFSIEQFSKQNIISVFFFWLYSERVKKLEASNTSKQFLSDHKFWILQSDRAPTPMTSNSFVYFYFPFVRSTFCKKKISDSWPGMIISLLWLTALLMFSNLIQIMEFYSSGFLRTSQNLTKSPSWFDAY